MITALSWVAREAQAQDMLVSLKAQQHSGLRTPSNELYIQNLKYL